MRFTTSLTPVAGLLTFGLAAATASAADPSYKVGVQPDGSIVMSTNQTITPIGKLVDLGSPVRAKAVALNPAHHTAAVLLMGADAPVQIFDLVTGESRQRFLPFQDSSGSYGGLTYSADGKYLFFSQDSSHLGIASVGADGLLSEVAQVKLPPDASIPLYSPGTAYPGGIAVSADGKSAYVLLNQNNTLGVVDLTRSPPVLTKQIRVGNVPNSVVVRGNLAYVSNEGGPAAVKGDVTDISSGTPIVVDPKTGSAKKGSVSVIDLAAGKVVADIKTELHPTGMTLSGSILLVANSFSDSITLIDTTTNRVLRTIVVGVPLKQGYGTNPSGIVVDGSVAYVTLATANAIAVVDLSGGAAKPLLGFIPTASFPTTIALDAARRQLVVSNDKGVGTQGSIGEAEGLRGYNSHQDSGVVNLIPIPARGDLPALSRKVVENNHWDRFETAMTGPFEPDPNAAPKAIPNRIGEPSFIKHVFLIIKENRTYDQVFGDVAKGNGDKSLALFDATITPNHHKLANRWPLFDNTYAPGRQSADGHPWIVASIAGYADEIQSPDWVRSYPSNSNDAMAYTPRGFLWQAATAKGLTARLYGEYSGKQAIAGNYSWADWYRFTRILEGKEQGTSPITPVTVTETTTIASAAAILDRHYPSFNTGIPDQYRVDYWLPRFQKDDAAGTVPALTIMWLPNDHTSGFSNGYPVPKSAVADNDLALGRIVAAISHGKVWKDSAIFIEEDDAQDGVDHVDGHRQPVMVVGPYVHQDGRVDHTIYTAANINRTIEQILGMKPLTQFDLVATPMTAAFTDTPNLAPYDYVPNTFPLDTFPPKAAANTVAGNWQLASTELFRQAYNKADVIDSSLLNHVIWYANTGFAKPYPGETAVKTPADFDQTAAADRDGDGDGQ